MSGDIGQIIDGKYRLTRLLGSGGMGAVYEGENLRIHRRVAIKMLHSQVSSQAETVTRFEREAQAAGRIGSEHICEVLDLGVMPDGTRYMVMEYLEGETLGARIKRFGRLTPQQAIPLVAQVLDALEAAHAVGIVHRDLKPDNVWIMPSRGGTKDFVKILDFGVSKFSQSAGGDEMNTTRAGSVVGTPYYMSPEQARGMGSIDGRTDVYAIGVVLYQAVTGQVPYQAETFNELLFKIVLEVPPPPQTYVPDLDPEVAGIILRAMSREPGQRYATCGEFKAALLAFAARGASAQPAQPARPVRSGLAAGGTAFLDASPMPLPIAAPPGATAAVPPPVQPPWGHAVSSPQTAEPPRAQAAGAPPGMIGVGPAGPQLASTTPPTAAWGNASGTGGAAPAKSKAGMAIGVCIGIVVVCGLATGVIFLRTSGSANAPEPSSSAASAPAAPPPASATAPAPAATAEASAVASASAAASASESAAPSAEPSATAESRDNHPVNNKRTFTPHPAQPKPPATNKTPAPRSVTGDLGY